MEVRRINGIDYTHLRADVIRSYLYDELVVFSVEAPNAIVQDNGYGFLDENGECYIFLDTEYTEIANTGNGYYVQLTGVGTANVYLAEDGLSLDYFIVKGEPNKGFHWTVTAEKLGTEGLRYNNLIGTFMDEIDEDAIIKMDEEIPPAVIPIVPVEIEEPNLDDIIPPYGDIPPAF